MQQGQLRRLLEPQGWNFVTELEGLKLLKGITTHCKGEPPQIGAGSHPSSDYTFDTQQRTRAATKSATHSSTTPTLTSMSSLPVPSPSSSSLSSSVSATTNANLDHVYEHRILHEIPALQNKPNGDMLRAEAVSNPTYWRELCPELTVGDDAAIQKARSSVLHPDPDLVDRCQHRMRTDGYFDIMAGEHLEWAVDLGALARAVSTLTEHGWPPGFLMMYDQPWILCHQVKELLMMTTGNSLIMDFAIFNVGGKRDKYDNNPSSTTTSPIPSSTVSSSSSSSSSSPSSTPDSSSFARRSSSGWPPHRDRGTDAGARDGFTTSGMPKYSTTWIPLTNATTSNSCLYVVPKKIDEGYHNGDLGKNPLETIFRSPRAFQNIRALPCASGSLIHFSHRLLHWGSTADAELSESKGDGPRVAMSFACASGGFEQPFFNRTLLPLPPLQVRCALIGGLALYYIANEDPGYFFANLCRDMFNAEAHQFDDRFVSVVKTNFRAHQSSSSTS